MSSSKDKKNNNGKKEKNFGLSFVLKILTVVGLVSFVVLQGYNYYAEDQEKEEIRAEKTGARHQIHSGAT